MCVGIEQRMLLMSRGGRAVRGTHYIRCARSVRVRRRVRVAPAACVAVGRAARSQQFGLARPGAAARRTVPLVYHQVDWHLALQTADVAVAEIVAQLVNLRTKT